MKGYLLISLAALAVSQVYAEVKCPPTGDVLLPNPADCHSYYRCLNGVSYLMPCPTGLEWNAAVSRCDYPEVAKCTETETQPPVKPTSAKPPVEKPDHCPEEDGPEDVLLPNPDDCGSFFKCLNGVPHLIPCPPGQEWSIELNRCDYPEIAKCTVTGSKPPVKPTTPKPPAERPDHCPEEDGPEDVLLPNPDDCGSFFKCLNGIPHLIPCPPGQEWSIELNRCDYPEIAKCTVTGSKPPVKPTTAKPPVERPDHCPEEDGPEDVLLPNPDDCGSFFKCLNGVPHLIPCPPGQEWSIELNRCDYPEIAKCTVTGSKPPVKPSTAKPPVERPDHCPEEDGPEDVLLPNPDDCGSFFKCLNGVPHLIPCPPGQEWSIELNRCDYPEIAKCKEIPFKPEHSVQDEKHKQCPAEDGPEDVLLPNLADCGSFYKCLGGVPLLIPCPAGLQWSVKYNRCEYPDIANCKETEQKPSTTVAPVKPSTTRKPPVSRPDHCPTEDGPEDVLLPNPDDCGSFFKCLGGVAYLIPCPPGLHWSIELNRCEYPSIANCKKAVPVW